jgi:hypothetical protein
MPETQTQRRLRFTPLPQELSPAKTQGVDWKDLVDHDKLVPFISNSISNRHLFKDSFGERILKWAKGSGCPWPEWQNVTAVAQYVLMADNESSARQKYLAHLKQELFREAADDPGVSDKQLSKIQEKLTDPDYSFSDLAYDLGYLDFEKTREHPLRLLASLPFKVYVTTSYHRFLEAALFQAGKQPVSEIYPWNSALEKNTTTIFQRVPDFTPTANQPLVYHLFGWDRQPDSLVLSENDYLDLLIKLSFDKGGSQVGANANASGELIAHGLPGVIVDRLVQDSAPLLLGYELQDWDFRVLFRGLIKATRSVRLGTGFFIQLLPDPLQNEAGIKTQLDAYLRTASGLKILWCTVENCIQELYTAWKNP